MGSFTRILLIAITVLTAIVWWQHRKGVRLKNERDMYQMNTEALLSDMKRLQIDSATMAIDVNALRLTESEYKRLRADDMAKIEKMGVRIKDLESVARHDIEINVPIRAPVTDSVVIRDFEPVTVQAVKMLTPYISLDGIIENDELIGKIHLPITLHQAVWIEYKRRWLFWKRVIAIHQTISSDNPHAEITYSEYIKIQK